MESAATGFHLRDRVLVVFVLALLSLAHGSMGARRLMELYEPDPSELLKYHNGTVLSGDIPVSILWYGRFTAAQKDIVSDFLASLSASPRIYPAPSVPQWWSSIVRLYLSKVEAVGKKGATKTRVFLSGNFSDVGCSLGRSLTLSQIPALAATAKPARGGVALLLTAQDVAVEGFCMSRCGMHGPGAEAGSAYVWVGNSAAQCPAQCAWPFQQEEPPVVPPNGDLGMDGLVINLASMLAGAVTDPFGDGFYQGEREAPLEAATACQGVYGSGAYPGNAGKLLIDKVTGASYNANGAHGRRYLLPALFDPLSSQCATLV
uniref:Uncharacterized protein n=1 Tax=Avena sativa TaxID=4498 RepID=A0ACD5ZQJ8_AVESA